MGLDVEAELLRFITSLVVESLSEMKISWPAANHGDPKYLRYTRSVLHVQTEGVGRIFLTGWSHSTRLDELRPSQALGRSEEQIVLHPR